MIRKVLACGLAMSLGVLAMVHLLAQENKPPQPVQVTATVSKPNAEGRQILTVKLAIEKGWHIYANPPGAAGPIPTTLQVSASVPLRDLQIEYPPGKAKTQAGETFRVYEEQAEIRVVVQRGLVNGQLDNSPLTVTIRYQACNDQICLPPRTLKVQVPPAD